ncbi:MAG: hypothetical protein RL456_1949 [Pseudomonadota bacterium]
MNRTQATARKTAAQSYQEHAARLPEKIAALQAALAEHAKKAGSDPHNWGYVGDVAHFETKIDELLATLGMSV